MLKCYMDSGWGGERKDRKSTSGYIFPWVVGQEHGQVRNKNFDHFII
jgi:hypothetical protein